MNVQEMALLKNGMYLLKQESIIRGVIIMIFMILIKNTIPILHILSMVIQFIVLGILL